MPEASHNHSTPDPGAIAAIGRRINALSVEHEALDKAALRMPQGSAARREALALRDSLFDEIMVLRERAGALQAETLGDVLTQALACCLGWAEDLHVNERSRTEVMETSAKLRRAAAGMATALARIGDFDLSEFGDIDDARFCACVLATPYEGSARADFLGRA